MNTPPECETEALNSGDILGLAKDLVNGHRPGILCTVNHEGNPEVRWMSSLAFDEFPVFYSLTAPGSRKVQQISEHSAVNWMFFNHNRSLIMNLRGSARVLTDTPTLKHIWRKVVDKTHTYFLDKYAKPPGFVVIETTVNAIECTTPASQLRFAIEPSELVERPL